MGRNPKPIRVLVVDDHPLLREGIASLISNQADIKLAGEASSGREAVEKFRLLHPDGTCRCQICLASKQSSPFEANFQKRG